MRRVVIREVRCIVSGAVDDLVDWLSCAVGDVG